MCALYYVASYTTLENWWFFPPEAQTDFPVAMQVSSTCTTHFSYEGSLVNVHEHIYMMQIWLD